MLKMEEAGLTVLLVFISAVLLLVLVSIFMLCLEDGQHFS